MSLIVLNSAVLKAPCHMVRMLVLRYCHWAVRVRQKICNSLSLSRCVHGGLYSSRWRTGGCLILPVYFCVAVTLLLYDNVKFLCNSHRYYVAPSRSLVLVYSMLTSRAYISKGYVRRSEVSWAQQFYVTAVTQRCAS